MQILAAVLSTTNCSACCHGAPSGHIRTQNTSYTAQKMESHAFPVISISEEWLQLLQDALGKGGGEVLAASLGCPEVVVNVPTGPDDEQPCLGEITQKSVAGNVVYIYIYIYIWAFQMDVILFL
jgi:hypothetical protein